MIQARRHDGLARHVSSAQESDGHLVCSVPLEHPHIQFQPCTGPSASASASTAHTYSPSAGTSFSHAGEPGVQIAAIQGVFSMQQGCRAAACVPTSNGRRQSNGRRGGMERGMRSSPGDMTTEEQREREERTLYSTTEKMARLHRWSKHEAERGAVLGAWEAVERAGVRRLEQVVVAVAGWRGNGSEGTGWWIRFVES